MENKANAAPSLCSAFLLLSCLVLDLDILVNDESLLGDQWSVPVRACQPSEHPWIGHL